MWWGVPEIQKAPTGIKPGILHDSQACYQVEPRIWGLLKFWKILNFNNFGFIIPLVSLSLSFPPELVDKRRNLSMKVSFSGQLDVVSVKYMSLECSNWKKRVSFNFVYVYTYYSHYFLATKATHLKTKQQESEWSHSTFGSDQNGPKALISACVQWVQLTGLYHWQMGLYWKPPPSILFKIH